METKWRNMLSMRVAYKHNSRELTFKCILNFHFIDFQISIS